MLEEQLAFYLEKYLGNYVKGLSKEALKVSVWQGNVELTNMQLKPEALNALKLPIKVKAGFLGSVKLKIPWSRLGQEPVVVELDRIYVLAEPATNVEGGDADSVQEAKNQRVREEEDRIVSAKEEDNRKKAEVSNSSWLGSLIGTVVGNLKLSITNIHIRYEDTESNAGHPFAAGLTLAKLAAVTVDENGKETFVTGGALDRIQKSGELNRLSFYFDSDTNSWPMEKPWEELLPKEWSKVFLPGIKEEPSAMMGEMPEWLQDHHYVLEPVGGTAQYFKLGQKDTRSPEKPAQKAVAILDDVTIALSEKQYRDVLKLAENISAFSKRVQFAHYRPNCSIMEDKCAWWRYAITAISEEHKKASGNVSWKRIWEHARMRKNYVSKYIEALQSKPRSTSINDNKEIQQLDRQLDFEIIIQWRMLAHAFVDQERIKDEEERRSKKSWWSFGWGGGVGDNDSNSKEFTDDDWKQLNSIIGYEEGKPSPLVPGEDLPNMLHTYVEVRMKHNGTKLLSAARDSILELSAKDLGCGIKLYPTTKVFNVNLSSYKILCPEGLLGESATEEKSLYGIFTLSPWDRQVDWILEAKAAPCYVTVLMPSINRVTQFFSNKEAVSRDVALQTAAALQSTVNEVSKNAQQQLNDALKDKPKFSLDLDIAAPKVTIPTEFFPDGQNRCKLFLDLGYFNIKTVPEDGSTDDSSEENQLYMRFRMGVNDVSAFLVDGDFDWRKEYIINPQTGRLQIDDRRSSTHLEDAPTSKLPESLQKAHEGKQESATANVQQVDEALVGQNRVKGDDEVGYGTEEGKQELWEAKKEVNGEKPVNGELFFLPVLEKTGMAIALEQICVPHSKYPTTRVAVKLPSLEFQFSPARYHRIMQVVDVFSGGSTDDSQDSAFRPWDPADFEGKMSVLSWKFRYFQESCLEASVELLKLIDGRSENCLCNKGVGHREAKWESRYGALAGPFLYLLESQSATSYKTYHSLIGKKVFSVPEESLGGDENVLAVCDGGQLENKVAESANALLLRFSDETAKTNWQGRFAGAIYRASSSAAVTGLIGGGKGGKEDSKEGVVEATEGSDQMNLAHQENFFLTGVLDELNVVVSNSLDNDHNSELLLLEPEKPLLEFRAIGTKVQFVMRKYDMLVGAVLQSLEIEDKYHGHVAYSCRYLARSYMKQQRKEKGDDQDRRRSSRSLDHIETHQRHGHHKDGKEGREGGLKQLAGGEGVKPKRINSKRIERVKSEDERYFDANDESGGEGSRSPHRQDSKSLAASKFYDAEDGETEESEPPSFKREVGLLPGSASPDPSQKNQDVTDKEELRNFVKAQVTLSTQESPEYANIDKEVRVSLSTLSFYCNRPTIIAVLDLVTAITAEVQPKEDGELRTVEQAEDEHQHAKEENKDDNVPSSSNGKMDDKQERKEEEEVHEDENEAGKGDSQPTTAAADGVVMTINPKVVEDIDEHGNPKIALEDKDSVVKGLLGKGKDRVVLMLVLDMELAEIVLNKEDGSRLSTLSQDDFHTEVKMYPASWGVKATLGNLQISDDDVKKYHHEGIPYQYICDMRDPGGSSFIELEFVSFNVDDIDYEGYEYSVKGKLSEVRLVFLNRFIQEITAYFMGLVPQSSGYVMKLKDRASDYEKLFTQSEIEGQPSLKLDLSLSKPIIIMPRGTHSTDFMELDILHINIRSSSEWFGGGKEELGAVRIETMTLEVEDVSVTVGVGGKTGEEILQQARGISLLLRRPLRDLWHKVPAIEATVKIDELRAALSDKEYQVISECVTQNMAEEPDLPPTLYDNKPAEDAKQTADHQAEKLKGPDEGDSEVVREDNPPEIEEAEEEGGSSPEKPYTTIKVGLGINLVELGLFVGGSRDASLATIQVSGVWAAYKGNNVEESYVMASLERFSVKDDRAGTAPEVQYMIGHADDRSPNTLEGDSEQAQKNSQRKNENRAVTGPSQGSQGWSSGLTMLVVDAKLGPTQQVVSLRIQRPRLIVAFDFLLAVGEFFVPSMHAMLADKGEENPLDMKNGMFLNERVYKQPAKKICISPKKPLFADYEGVYEYVYDGQGNTLCLRNRNDRDLSDLSPEALIFVGDNRRLIFRNVVIQNGDYLDSSISLGVNSSYSALRDDGVFMEGPPEESDDGSSVQSDDKEQDAKTDQKDKPPPEFMLDLQAIGPELTFFDSLGRPSDALSERHLRARMNAFARFTMKGDDMELIADLNGFNVEATSGVNVLEPFDVSVKYSKVTGKQNIHVGMTEIYTNFSFSILQLILRLQEDVMSLMRITAEQITVECSEFDKIWADDDREVESGGFHIAFWRPRPPPGFAALGDCFTPLDEPPAKGVLALNVVLARAKRPIDFKLVWSSTDLNPNHQINRSRNSFGNNGESKSSNEQFGDEDLEIARQRIADEEEENEKVCSVWLPIPPEDYVALGCVVCRGQEAPPKSSALCVMSALVSPCSMRDCIQIAGQYIDGSKDHQKRWAFWRVDNSTSTFFTEGDHTNTLKGMAFDLRHVISSYGAFTVKETKPAEREDGPLLSNTLSSIDEEDNQDEAAGLLTAVISSGRIYENVGRFKLVWWDKGSGSRGGISIWRPVVPPGCAMLGDLAVKGYEPPSTGLVLRDTEEDGLLNKPERFQEVGHLAKGRQMEGAHFWVPIAPPGYSAIGCIAGRSSHPDKDAVEIIRCVRNDLVTGVKFANSSIWSTSSAKVVNQELSIWPVENEPSTFFVKVGSYSSPSRRLALGLADLRKPAEPDNLTMAAEVQQVSATFYDDFGGFMAPLLEFSITGVQTHLHGRLEALSTSANFSLSATTYNGKYDVWEPMVEPCDAFARFEYSSDPQDKVLPTITKVRINAISDLNVNVSVANANMLLEAYASWTNMTKIEEGKKNQQSQDKDISSRTLSRRVSSLSTGNSLDGKSNKGSFIVTHNEVGEQLWLRTNDGSGRPQVMPLPPNGTAAIKLPTSRRLQDPGTKKMASKQFGKFVALRIGDSELPKDEGIGGREYMAAVRIVPENSESDNRQIKFQSARTRCVNPESESEPGRVSVIWNEVFVFEVQAGEFYNTEVVITDLARGVPVGFCSFVLLQKAKDGSEIFNNEAERNGPIPWSSLELKTETLYPPKIEQEEANRQGEVAEDRSEEDRFGKIGIAEHFFSAGEEQDTYSELAEISHEESSRKPGAIQVSASKHGPWSPVGLNYALGPAPWHLGKDHLASEIIVSDSIKHLFVRTMVNLMNETECNLEVRLCPDFLLSDKGDADSTLGQDRADFLVEVEIFENERHQFNRGWGHPLLPTDPGHWCTLDFSDSSKEFPKLPLPQGWVWTTDWRLDRAGGVDQDGWAYAYDFRTLKNWPPASGYEKAATNVRRRRWVRSRQRKESNKNLYLSLGTVEPHSTVACPLESLRSGSLDYIIQVRPQTGALGDGLAHNWSSVVPYNGKPDTGINKHPVKKFLVRNLQETEELLCCPVEASSSTVEGRDVWLCVECKATEIGKTTQLDPILDWRLTVSAPLELVNFLPVTCEYKVFEKVAGKASVMLHEGMVEPGQSQSLYQADLRKGLYLSWVPQDGWALKQDAVLLSHPGKDAEHEIVVTNGVRDLAIHIQHTHGDKDVSGKVIQLYVPCWIDSKKCPSLKYKLVEVEHPGGKKEKKDRKTRVKKKVFEEIDQEDMHQHPTLLSTFDCNCMGLAVALSGEESTDFGPVASLDPLEDANGSVDLRAVDSQGSHFRFLVTTTSDPYDFPQTQVVRLRPYTLFTNRLGQPLQIRQAGVDQSKTLQPFDWRTTFSFPEVQDPLNIQIQLEGSQWSLPFAIDREETIHVVMRCNKGTRIFVRVDVRGYEDGSRYLVNFQLGSSRGPYRIENRTGSRKLKLRQVGQDEGSWQTLRPHSTLAFAWENLHGEQCLELLLDGVDPTKSTNIDINKLGDHPMVTTGRMDSSDVSVRVLEAVEVKVVRVFDQQMETHGETSNNEGEEIQVSVPTQGAAEPMQPEEELRPEAPSQMELVLNVGKLGLSIVDHRPRELVYLVMEKVDVLYGTGLGENVSRLKILVGYLQLDNQLPLTPMPVLLAPEPVEGEDFVLKVIASTKSDTAEATQVYPYLGLKDTGSAWRINVHEAIIWAFLDLYNNLHLDRLSSDSQVVQVDPEIRIETMDVSEVRLKLSVETSPDQRPRGKLGIWGPAVSTIGNISKMPIRLRNVFCENRRMRKSQVQTEILNRVKRDLIHQPLQLLTGVNVLGMTSSTLGTMSRGVGNLSKDTNFMQVRANQEKSRKVTGVGDGVLQGTESFARGVTYGFKGIVTKPVEGTRDRGAVGCFQGVGKAFIGVIVQPLSGCLDFMALSVSGIGTSCTNCFDAIEHEPKFQRSRLPRAIKGDGVLTPYDEYAAHGQAILQLAQSGAYFGSKDVFKDSGKYAFTDFYQEHFYLPENRILMLSNQRVLMLLRPESHRRDANNERVDPCTIQWELQWSNLLAMEEAHDQSDRGSMQVLLHLRNSSRNFTQVVGCNPPDGSQTTQASQIYKAIHHQWKAFYPDPQDPSSFKKTNARRFRRKPKAGSVWDASSSRMSITSSQAQSGRTNTEEGEGSESELDRPDELTDVTVVNEFRLDTSLGTNIWTLDDTNRSCMGFAGGDTLSFWRPSPPPGYVSVGDVALVGDYSESQTVTTYWNDEGKFETPSGFDLVWRNWKDGSGSPISIWMPRAPEGYVALGCVAVADYQEPELDSVWCAHQILTEETTLEDNEIWKSPSEAPWHCYLYPVVSEAHTFIALREEKHEGTPKPRRVVI